MRGLGPYVINEITSRGAACLETLDGEPMANFINGSCLKHFHEPLTPKMLEKMHATKTKKLAIKNVKKEAQDEARQRETKAKAGQHQISVAATFNTDEVDYVPPMLLKVGIPQTKTTCNALLDLGAMVNVMAKHIFNKFMNRSLIPTTKLLNSVSDKPINFKGVVTTSINVGEHKEECVFYVTPLGSPKNM